jgi:WD40 repeat protein
MLASGSADNTLKIWNAKTGNCESTLIGHQLREHFQSSKD